MSKTIYQLDAALSLSLGNKGEVSQSNSASSESKYYTFQQLLDYIVNPHVQLASPAQITGFSSGVRSQLSASNGITYNSSTGAIATKLIDYAAPVSFVNSSFTLTNPAPANVTCSANAPGNFIKLPPAQGANALAIGQSINIYITQPSQNIVIKDSDDNDLLTMKAGQSLDFVLADNSTPQGTWLTSSFYPIMNADQILMGSSDGGYTVGSLISSDNSISITPGTGNIDLKANLPAGFTEGSVLFADSAGDISQNNNKFFWDNTLFRLGVGDSNSTLPASTLQVSDNNSTGGVNNGITIAQYGSGDAVLQYLLNSSTRWITGIDNSDSDKWKISVGSDLGTFNALSIDPSNRATTFTGDVFLNGSPASNLQAATKQYVDTTVSTSGSAFLTKANNLSDLTNVSNARSNLDLGLNSVPQFTGLTLESGFTPPLLNLINDGITGSSGAINFSANLSTLYGKINNILVSDGAHATMQFSVLGAGGYQNYFELDGAAQTAHFHKSLTLDIPLSASNINYNSSNLTNNSGALDINSTAEPTLAALTLLKSGGAGLLTLRSDSATNGLVVGGYDFVGKNSAASLFTYSFVRGGIGSNTSGSERGYFDVYVRDASGNTNYINLDGSTGTINLNKSVNVPGLNVSALTANSAVFTDASKNLTTNSPAVLTYTPTIGDGTNNFTTTTATGQYQKIGHLYIGQIFVAWTSKGSASSGSQLRVSFPTAVGASNSRVSLALGYLSGIGFTGSQLVATASSGNSYATFFGFSNVGLPTPAVISQSQNAGELQAFFAFLDN
jgi:hypothetical protein